MKAIVFLAAALLASTTALAVVPATPMTGAQISPQAASPISAGSAGFWNNGGVPEWVYPNGSMWRVDDPAFLKSTGSYANPAWLTSVSGSIVSGAVATATNAT